MKETIYAKFWVSDGIMFFIYKPIAYLDFQTAKMIVDQRLRFQKETQYPILCDTQGIKNSAKSARDYLANEGSTFAKAVAIVDNRHIANVMLRFYLIKNKPLVPSKIYETQEDALIFLNAFK
jgi:thermostable 8-oxoguanine DNA glycosylase